jgi:PAS domain S-box-containing protein
VSDAEDVATLPSPLEWFRVTLSSIGDGVITADSVGAVTYLNAVAEQLTGWSSAEAVGRPMREVLRIVNETTRREVENPVFRVLREGTVVGLANHTTLIDRNGAEHHIDDSAAPIRDGRGRVLGVVLIFRDISEKRAAERRLEESEQRFRLMVESVKDYAIFMLDPGGHVATWNAGAGRIKGYRPDEVIGRHFSTFYTPEDAASGKPARLLEAAVRDGRVEDEGWRVRKDGSRFWADVVITALLDKEGRLRGFGKVTRDLTERRAAEESLRLSEERIRLMVESVKDYAIFMLDPGGNVATWNSGAERLKGYTPGEIIGRHFSAFYPPQDVARGEPDRELEVAVREGRIEDEGWRVRKDGSRFWANVVITALWDKDGRLRGFGKVTRDLTERKAAEDRVLRLNGELEQRVGERTTELAAANARLQEEVAERRRVQDDLVNEKAKLEAAVGEISRLNSDLERRVQERTAQLTAANRELEAFCYSVSHDLRSPLRAVDGFSRILIEDHAPGMGPEVGRYLKLVRDNAQFMGRLIDDLLAFSRLGRQAMARKPIAPAEIARQVVADLRAEQAGRTVELRIGDLPECEADPALLRQVFTNLLSNALKFTRKRNPAVIEVGATQDGNGSETYFVRDNGVGFDMQYAGKLFGVFQRLHRNGEFEGTGVGLALVQRIILRHGGRIWAEAALDKGATFHFTLPKGGGHDSQ